MPKTLALILAIVLSVAACGGDETPAGDPAAATDETNDAEPTSRVVVSADFLPVLADLLDDEAIAVDNVVLPLSERFDPFSVDWYLELCGAIGPIRAATNDALPAAPGDGDELANAYATYAGARMERVQIENDNCASLASDPSAVEERAAAGEAVIEIMGETQIPAQDAELEACFALQELATTVSSVVLNCIGIPPEPAG